MRFWKYDEELVHRRRCQQHLVECNAIYFNDSLDGNTKTATQVHAYPQCINIKHQDNHNLRIPKVLGKETNVRVSSSKPLLPNIVESYVVYLDGPNGIGRV